MIPRVVTAQQVYEALIARGVPSSQIRLLDATYRLPDFDYVFRGAFWREYHEDLHSLGLDVWGPDWDCDDFALDFTLDARKSHKCRQRESGEFVAESVAIFFVTATLSQPGVAGSHAFILIAQWDEAAGALTFRAVEPQPNALYREYNLQTFEWVTAFVL